MRIAYGAITAGLRSGQAEYVRGALDGSAEQKPLLSIAFGVGHSLSYDAETWWEGHFDDEAKELIRLMPRSTEVLGFTGGEPTLFGDRFLETLRLTETAR